MSDFAVEISQNEYLAEGAEDVNAIVTVTLPDSGLAPGRAAARDTADRRPESARDPDGDTATAKLGRAVALAEQSGNEGTAKLLAKVVDVVDAASGTVQLKKRVDDADEMALDTRSTKTVRTKK